MVKIRIASYGLSFLLVIGWYICPGAEAREMKGRDIAVLVDERPDGDDSKGTMKMTLINNRGRKREREVLFMKKDYGKDSKSIIYFKFPADIKGSSFLQFEYDDPSREDDKWLYLPALKKVRRISGSSRKDYFMGTDFTYDDLGDRSVDEDVHTLLREEELDGHECWVLESRPVAKGYIYSKKIGWIRKDVHISIKVEFYDRQGSLTKVLTASDIRKQEDIWTVFKYVMDNLERKHKTILEYQDINYNTGLKDEMFRVSTLERGRLR